MVLHLEILARAEGKCDMCDLGQPFTKRTPRFYHQRTEIDPNVVAKTFPSLNREPTSVETKKVSDYGNPVCPGGVIQAGTAMAWKMSLLAMTWKD